MARTKQTSRWTQSGGNHQNASTSGEPARKQKRMGHKGKKLPDIGANEDAGYDWLPNKSLTFQFVRYEIPERRQLPFDIIPEEGDDIRKADLRGFHRVVRGSIKAYRNNNSSSGAGWLRVETLNALTNEDLKGTGIRKELSCSENELKVSALKAVSEAGSDAIWLNWCDPNGVGEVRFNPLNVQFDIVDGDSTKKLKFSDCLGRSLANELQSYAISLYKTYKRLKRTIETMEGFQLSKCVAHLRWTLEARRPNESPMPPELYLNTVMLVSYTRIHDQLACVPASLANGMAALDTPSHTEFAEMCRTKKINFELNSLKSVNRIFHTEACESIFHWPNFRLEHFMDKNYRIMSKFQNLRLEKVLANRGNDPLIVSLMDSESCNTHVVAIVNLNGKHLISDNEEERACPLTKQGLDWCCGSDLNVIGITEVFKLVMRKKKN